MKKICHIFLALVLVLTLSISAVFADPDENRNQVHSVPTPVAQSVDYSTSGLLALR